MIESCFKLGLMYRKCLQTLFWLVFTGNERLELLCQVSST